MAAKKAPEKHVPPRNFGHCIISWKIKNFSLAICNPGTEVCTDEFPVTSLNVTRWRLGFRVDSDGSALLIFLRRIGGEPGKSLEVSWKITILNGKDEATFVSYNQGSFSKDSEKEIAVASPFDIIRALPGAQSDEVNFKFQMIVLMNTTMHIPTPNEAGYLALIDDMKAIVEANLLCDLIILLGGKFMKAHMAVICKRSKRLSPLTGYQSKKISLYLSDIDSINRVIVYFYTGDLKIILDPPSIPVYDYIVHLDIKELRNAYPQEKISLETAAEATNYEFRWIIQDFNCPDELRESEIYEADGTGVKWQLRVYPKEVDEETEIKRKYIYIEAQVVSCDEPQDVFVNFIAKNDKGMITVAKRTYGRVTSGMKLGVFFMRIGATTMAKSVVDNVFDVIFAVHTATGKMHSRIIKIEPPVPLTVTNYNTFEIFRNYMGLLQSEDCPYSDITLVVQDQEFKAHKFLLAGRSAIFARMIEGMKKDSTALPLLDMHKHVFRVFLDYLYRGVMTDREMSVLIHLHDIACHFKVTSLQTLCVKALEDQLTPQSCCFLLLFAHERIKVLSKFKEDILQYLSIYREGIINTEGWNRMEAKSPHLYYEVVCYLGNHPVVPQRRVQR